MNVPPADPSSKIILSYHSMLLRAWNYYVGTLHIQNFDFQYAILHKILNKYLTSGPTLNLRLHKTITSLLVIWNDSITCTIYTFALLNNFYLCGLFYRKRAKKYLSENRIREKRIEREEGVMSYYFPIRSRGYFGINGLRPTPKGIRLKDIYILKSDFEGKAVWVLNWPRFPQ